MDIASGAERRSRAVAAFVRWKEGANERRDQFCECGIGVALGSVTVALILLGYSL